MILVESTAISAWDPRNATTKTRVSGRRHMPLVALYIPSQDLVRQGGRIADSGTIVVSLPVPFKIVKEVWLLVPSSNHYRII